MTMDAETTTDGPPPAPSVDALASSLPQPVREYAELAFRPPESGLSTGSEEDQASARVDRLEVSLRGRLLAITGQILDDGDGGGGGEGVLLAYFREVARLVLETVRLVSAEEAGGGGGSGGADDTDNAGGGGAGIRSLIASSPSFKRLPFLLLEDAIDSLPFTSVQSAWTGGLSSLLCPRSGLCSPAVFGQQSKFVLLRITNKLLRQCSSRGSDSGFAGGLMRMTASVFPLSERSAVNVLGTFHGSGNPTTVEGRDEFEGRRRKASQDATGDRGGQSPDGVGYEFYETFWGIQAVFADPPSTVLPSRTLGQKAALERYNAFMEGAGKVLSALESTPVSSQSSSSSATARPADGGAPAAAAVRHHKYLTNSSLLHLQLRDGTLRSHVLTQLLVVLKYLAGNHASLPTGPINATPGGDAAKLTQQINKGQVKQLAALDRRARDLLRATSGPDAVNLVSWLLKEREAGWKVWKKNRCMPALDRAGPPDVSGRDVRALLLSGRKRKALAAAADGAADNNGGGSIDVRRDLPGIAAGINAEVPKVDSFLEPYREALDPENEIDDEYHPRNDGVYSWRALRLLSRDASSAGPAGQVSAGRISRLRASDGDFEAVVRDARAGDGEIGGGLPTDYFQRDVVARTALEEVPPAAARAAAAAKADGDGAADDDSVSVGSLFEEDEDTEVERKEQMREFERAAMEVEREMLGGSSHSIKAEEPEEVEKKEKNKTDEAGASSPAAKNENNKEEKGSAASKESGGPERKRIKTEDDDGGNAAAAKAEPRVKAEPKVKAEDRRAADHPKPSAAPTRGGHGHQHGRGGDSRQTTRQQENPRGGRAKFTPPDRKGQGRDGDHPQQQQQQRDESRGRRGGPGGGGGGKGRFADRNDPPHQQNQQQQRPRGAGDDRRGGGGHGVNPRDGGRGGDSRPPHDAEFGRRGGERRDHNQDGGRRGNDGGGKGDVNGGRADKGRRDSSNSNNNKNRGDGGGDQQPHRGRGRQQHPQNNNRPTIENGGGRGDINQQQKQQQQPRPRFEPPGGQGRGWGGGGRRHNNSQQRGRGGRNN